MKNIQFVSYSGEFPCLCSGNLVLSIDGKKHVFSNILVSGGMAGIDFTTYEEFCEEGEWSIYTEDDAPNGGVFIRDNKGQMILLTREEFENLIELVNENVPLGCCGGCI